VSNLKRVLITGKNSYVGTNVEKWLMKEPDKYYVESISVRGEQWKSFDFSTFDVVLHVAGIAHIKETRKNRHLYSKINTDLANDVAIKTKSSNVKHFIFLSSMSVYGIKRGGININTEVNPKTAYGKSKYIAELFFSKLEDSSFRVSIISPPMIYGKNCKGNYSIQANFELKTPVFTKTNNEKTMIYIDNLSELIKIIIDDEINGTFFPQNNDYVKKSSLVDEICKIHGKKIIKITLFNFTIRLLNLNMLNKLFGDLYYDKSISMHNLKYAIVDFERSIFNTETDNV